MVQVCVGGCAQGAGAYCRHVGSHSEIAPGPAHTQRVLVQVYAPSVGYDGWRGAMGSVCSGPWWGG